MASHACCTLARSSVFASLSGPQAPAASSLAVPGSTPCFSRRRPARRAPPASPRSALPLCPSSAAGCPLRHAAIWGTPLRSPVAAQRSPSCRQAAGGLSVTCGERVADIKDAEFEAEVVSSSLPVLVDFHASWCGPCKLVAPLMDWAAETYDGKLKVVKVDVEKNPQTTEKYRVYGLPTVVIFESGKVVSQQEGAITKAKLDKLLKEKLPALA